MCFFSDTFTSDNLTQIISGHFNTNNLRTIYLRTSYITNLRGTILDILSSSKMWCIEHTASSKSTQQRVFFFNIVQKGGLFYRQTNFLIGSTFQLPIHNRLCDDLQVDVIVIMHGDFEPIHGVSHKYRSQQKHK